jgi:Putative transposase of IS4/5 family (DUF4096)
LSRTLDIRSRQNDAYGILLLICEGILTPIHYGAMSTRYYDTDLNDAAWAWIAPYLPAGQSGRRPRTTDLRAVLNAIFYLLRTGC